tara:strand:- start:50424 stop:51209 length:786 start_codon:yes stop_codon:yes gene_type:complete
MAVALDDLTDEYFEKAIAREEILFDKQTGLPIIEYTSVLEHPPIQVTERGDIAKILGVMDAPSLYSNLEKIGWVLDENRHTTTERLELYIYYRAKVNKIEPEKRKSQLKESLQRLHEYERSHHPEPGGVVIPLVIGDGKDGENTDSARQHPPSERITVSEEIQQAPPVKTPSTRSRYVFDGAYGPGEGARIREQFPGNELALRFGAEFGPGKEIGHKDLEERLPRKFGVSPDKVYELAGWFFDKRLIVPTENGTYVWKPLR